MHFKFGGKIDVETDLEIILISGNFCNSKKERQLILTFKNGVRAFLYLAPQRSANDITVLTDDDISLIFLETCSIENCL